MQKPLLDLSVCFSLLLGGALAAAPQAVLASSQVSDANAGLIAGIQQENTQQVIQMLLKGASPNQQIQVNQHLRTTPLLWAARKGDLSLVLLLLEKGADPNLRIPKGNTAIMWAAWHGNLEMLKALLAKGADLKLSKEGQTALSYAAGQGRLEILKYLQQKGQSLEHPLILVEAVYNQQQEVVSWLLAQGVDINARVTEGPEHLLGKTALQVAQQWQLEKMIKFLLSRGAQP